MILIEFLRQFRILNYAIFDFIVAFVGIYFLAPFLSKIFLKFRLDIPRISWMYFVLPIGIISHLLCGDMTPMTRNFFDPNGHYLLKIFILVLLFLGIRKIKIIKK
jgi:hypothetical protein